MHPVMCVGVRPLKRDVMRWTAVPAFLLLVACDVKVNFPGPSNRAPWPCCEHLYRVARRFSGLPDAMQPATVHHHGARIPPIN